MNIDTMYVDIFVVVAIILAVAGWAFTLGKLYAKVNETAVMTTKIYQELVNQDERIDTNEKAIEKKLDKSDFEEFMRDYTVHKTEHNLKKCEKE